MRCLVDLRCGYVKKFESGIFLIINDMLTVRRDMSKIEKNRKDLSKSLDMKDLGPVRKILEIKITLVIKDKVSMGIVG